MTAIITVASLPQGTAAVYVKFGESMELYPLNMVNDPQVASVNLVGRPVGNFDYPASGGPWTPGLVITLPLGAYPGDQIAIANVDSTNFGFAPLITLTAEDVAAGQVTVMATTVPGGAGVHAVCDNSIIYTPIITGVAGNSTDFEFTYETTSA